MGMAESPGKVFCCRCTVVPPSVWKNMTLNRGRVLIAIGLLIVLAGVGGVAAFLGDHYALSNLSVRQVTPDELAAAMQNDRFYSDYNEATLVVRGVVASLAGDGGGAVLQFQTQGAYQTHCQFDQYPSAIHPGDTITVVTEGATADRLSTGVLLKGCRLPGE